MPQVRYTADGGHYRVGGHGFDPGDTKDVDADLAEYLVDRDDFELVGDDVDESDQDDGADAVSEETDDQADEFGAAAFVGRMPMEDVIADIHAGEADDHLDAVAEAADRVGVQDAVGERRAELEG